MMADPTPAVEAENLVLAYGTRLALAESSFTIPTGRVTAVIGPNGSGKSTVLNAIAGLIEPRSGSIRVAARDEASHRIAYVLQTTKVNDSLPISVKEVVRMGRYSSVGIYGPFSADDRAAVEAAMERVGVAGLANRRLQNLSGGQRQRVFVAQGLAQDHDMLLLDEPLTGIDLPTAQAIDDVIHEERDRGRTVVMTTHDLSEARVADHVLLVSGRVVAHGPPAAVLTTRNLTEAYGTALIHGGHDEFFLDDPAHEPASTRHVHRERIIHPEAGQGDHPVTP